MGPRAGAPAEYTPAGVQAVGHSEPEPEPEVDPETLYPCQPVFLDGVMVGVVGSCGPQPTDWRMLCIIAVYNLAILSMGP